MHLSSFSGCLVGKKHRVSFVRNNTNKCMKVLERVYSDVCGSMKIVTPDGASYFVTFIDDACRKVWAYIMKTKDEVLDHFKIYMFLLKET